MNLVDEQLSNESLGIAPMNETSGSETKYVASANGENYESLQTAISKADEQGTVTLTDDVALDAMLVIDKPIVLDLGTHTISASDAFQRDSSASYNNHLVDIQADGVIIKNGVLQAGSNNNHTLNVYQASNVTLQDLTLDNTNTYGGAPLIVGSSDVTLAGSVNFVTGTNSWYSVNVDGAYNPMTLTFAENAKVSLGSADVGIQVDRSTADKMVTLDFKSNVQVTGSTVPLVLNTVANNNPSKTMTVKGLENTNLTASSVAGAVATAGQAGVYYATLQDAVDAAEGDTTVQLQQDATEDVVIPKDKTITLDLNGHNLTNVKDHTITNNGTLTVTGEGTVDNITHGKGAVYNNVGAVATLSGGTYTRSKENGASSSDSGDNSWYAIKNFGTMTINDGVTVKFDGAFSSLVANGWYNYVGNSEPNPNGGTAMLIINGGTFSGGLNTIKNDDGGVLGINGGTFSNVAQHAVLNVNEATINGGTFDVTGNTTGEDLLVATVCNRAYNTTYDKGQLTITGGKFSAPAGKSCIVAQNQGVNPTVNVSGGYFTNKVDGEYITIADGKACNLLDSLYEGKYAYQVGEKAEDVAQDVVLKPEAPDTSATKMDSSDIPDVDGMNEEDKTALANDINAAAGAIKVNEESQTAVSNAALVEAKIDGYKVNSEKAKKIAKTALEGKLESGDALKDDGDITITVTPVLKIDPKAPVEKDGKLVGVSFDIKLMYKVSASAETKQGNKVEAELGTETAVSNPPVMKMTIPNIPADALSYEINAVDPDQNNPLYVRHEHGNSVYYYTTEVTEDSVASTVSVTFTNRHGFSLMTVINDTTKAEVKYPMRSDPQPYDVTSVSTLLPAPQKEGFTFNGWTFAGVEGGPYKVMTEDLLAALAKAYAANNNTAVVATASYTDNTADGNSTTQNNSASTTTTQSGGNITYYTCPACGYHNWTATAEGYKCDHCGYVESVKQLSGYGNVKGIYEPKTSTAAAQSASGAAVATATSAIPQTSDELPLAGLVVVAIAALLGLGVTVVLKKRSNR